jgi:hypothetical protein
MAINKSAGYSGTPLIQKLGIKPGMRICILHAPADYAKLVDPTTGGVSLKKLGKEHSVDFIHWFGTELALLTKEFANLRTALAYTGTLWISWPKRASKVETDLDEGVVRRLGLKVGLVDVKIAAIDDTWSGLKFMYRLKDRPGA